MEERKRKGRKELAHFMEGRGKPNEPLNRIQRGGFEGVHRLNGRLRSVEKTKHRPHSSETASALEIVSGLISTPDRKFPRGKSSSDPLYKAQTTVTWEGLLCLTAPSASQAAACKTLREVESDSGMRRPGITVVVSSSEEGT